MSKTMASRLERIEQARREARAAGLRPGHRSLHGLSDEEFEALLIEAFGHVPTDEDRDAVIDACFADEFGRPPAGEDERWAYFAASGRGQ